ncbi:Signal transduction histidine kinase [Pseudonocardia ammonioxydans]|uniref:Signal transduction histidine kinase n=1 Tax=Pseudonocardia ammonioxydans TaxID=260086 RepID=A0A1I4S9W2_PSUAM|nr:sensor histidine kinase [Pseudonocardia ammonioxydans]SFM61272.1 Signal transduction histidine kinase [Pseudonocardia ammonioxydans]
MTGSDPHVWERLEPAWHAAFALFVLVTAALVVTNPDAPTVAGTALLAVIGLVHALLAPPAMRDAPSRLGAAYLAVTVPATVALFALTPVGSVMLFVLFPMVWRLLGTRAAVVVTVGLVAAVTAIGMLLSGAAPGPGYLALYGGAALSAVLLGLWITSIAAQSDRRAALLAELERTRCELAAAHREAGALAERERMARDIHDTLAQGFTSLTLLVRAAAGEIDRDPAAARRHLDLAERTARENLAETRALVRAAPPAPPAGDPLPVALSRLVARCGEAMRAGAVGGGADGSEADRSGAAGAGATLDTAGWDPPGPGRCTPEREIALLRIAQEALANVRRHAAASAVAVTLRRAEGGTRLEIRDDGRGFDPAAERDGRFGVNGMHGRATELGGTLTVLSAPGAGCRVIAWIPDTAPDAPGTEARAPQETAPEAADPPETASRETAEPAGGHP